MEAAKQKLGLWTSTSLVIGNMIGAGVFMLPAALAGFGSISLVGWGISTLGALLLAKTFANLSKLLPAAEGGPYAYTRAGFGDFTGYLIAWGYLISVWSTNAAMAIAFISAMSTFLPILIDHPIVEASFGLTTIWLLTWINTRGIMASGRLQLVTTLLKILPLLAISAGSVYLFRNWHPISFNSSGTSSFSAISTTGTLTFFAFLGLECATIPAGSVQDPEKTIPRATMLGTLITAAIYILSTICLMLLIPAKDLAHSLTPFADAGVLLWGNSARYWISAGIAIAAFGTLNGFILVQGQVSMAMAKDRLFPPFFARINKNGVPALGIVVSSIFISLMLCMNYTQGLAEQFKTLILLSTFTNLVPYLFTALALLLIRISQHLVQQPGWTVTCILGIATFIFTLWAIAGSGQDTIYWGFLLLMAGVPFYVWTVWKTRK